MNARYQPIAAAALSTNGYLAPAGSSGISRSRTFTCLLIPGIIVILIVVLRSLSPISADASERNKVWQSNEVDNRKDPEIVSQEEHYVESDPREPSTEPPVDQEESILEPALDSESHDEEPKAEITEAPNNLEDAENKNSENNDIIGNETSGDTTSIVENESPIQDNTEATEDEVITTSRHESLFDSDPPGLDAVTIPRHSLWQYEISLEVNNSRTDRQRRHPEFAFIKGLKVGGTSVAMALDSVARRYGIRLQSRIGEARNQLVNPGQVPCVSGGSLWFHHGFKHSWMQICMPNVRFLTVLRDPISQTLSWEAMGISRQYYLNYPDRQCKVRRQIPITKGKKKAVLLAMLREVERCVDTPYRKNLTMMLVADAVKSFHEPHDPQGVQPGEPGVAVSVSTAWIHGGSIAYPKLTKEQYVQYLQDNYFLVGVTEHLNEFLVLLALHMGWELSSLYYMYCKPTTSDVHRSEFAHHFPELMPKLERSTRVPFEVYTWAKKEFNDHVERLGPWFKDVVRDFEAGLKKYHAAHEIKDRPFQWRPHVYLDHHVEQC